MDFRGDINVLRTGNFAQRANQGLLASAISGTKALLVNDARWQDITATGAQDVTLPDATTLTNGWEVVVNALGDTLTVKDGGAGGTIQVVTAGTSAAYLFTLEDNGAAAGVWYVTALDLVGATPAARYTATFNASTDWGSPSAGYYTITTTAATHGRGVNPNIDFYETDGSTGFYAVAFDRSAVNASGDNAFRVPEVPDLRVAGKAVYV